MDSPGDERPEKAHGSAEVVASHGTGGCATRANGRLLLCGVAAVVALAACGSKRVHVAALSPAKPANKSAAGGGAGVPTFPDTGINASTLTVTGIERQQVGQPLPAQCVVGALADGWCARV